MKCLRIKCIETFLIRETDLQDLILHCDNLLTHFSFKTSCFYMNYFYQIYV